MDLAAMRSILIFGAPTRSSRRPRHSSVGRQWACLRLFRHLAIDHQHGDDDHHVPDDVLDPEHSKPRHTAIQLKLDELIRANENAQNRMMKLEDLTKNQIKQLKESLAAGPLDAVREPLEAAQEGLAEVSGDIEEAKGRLVGRDERT
jgi:hypothetical protein